MKDIRFQYNPETLSYHKIEVSKHKSLLQKIGIHFIISLIILPSVYLIGTSFIVTPREYSQEKEIKKLLLQYKVLNSKFDKVQTTLSQMKLNDDEIYRTIFNAEPIPESVRQGGIGGNNPYEELEMYKNSELMINTSKKIEALETQMQVQHQSFAELLKMANKRKNRINSIPAIQPVSPDKLNHPPYGFGPRLDPVYKIPAFHYGMDFSAPTGTPIYATGNGKVIDASFNKYGYGNNIRIDHGFGYVTVYAHLHAMNVKNGEEIKRGQIIGTVGNTGKSVGPHLHYEVRIDGQAVNPINYFFNDVTPEQYEKMYALASATKTKLD